MPYRVRTHIQRLPSRRSMIMGSSQLRSFRSGTVAVPRSDQVFPWSVDATTRLLPSPCQMAVGNSHAPSLVTVGLHIMMPSQMSRGFDHVGVSSFGLSVVVANK